MNAYLLNLVVLAQALMLALPPGVCCADLGGVDGTRSSSGCNPQTAVSPACCSHVADQSQPVSPCGHAPTKPVKECCCRHETAVAVKLAGVRHDDLSLSLPVALLPPATT